MKSMYSYYFYLFSLKNFHEILSNSDFVGNQKNNDIPYRIGASVGCHMTVPKHIFN